MAKRPKVLLSDEPLEPEEVLPRKVHVSVDDVDDDFAFEAVPDEDENSEPEPDDPTGDDGFLSNDADSPTEAPYVAPVEDTPPPDKSGAAPAATPHPTPKPLVAYRSRISVVEGWQYPGSLTKAPLFVDRSWTGWDDSGGLQGQPSGPCLRVPVVRSLAGPTPSDGIKICRVGDYVVRQNVTLAEGLAPDEVIDVWSRDDFERLFIPSNAEAS